MKKPITINVRIVPFTTSGANLYKVTIEWRENGALFTDNKNGKGYSLEEAQHVAFNMRDSFKKVS